MSQLLKIFYVLILVFLVTACGSQTTNAMLKPGDNIHGMTLAKGTAGAVPLWAFCSSPQQNEQMIITECHVPLSIKLAIGQVFSPTDKTLADLDWSDLTWDLSIDGQSLDLAAFGTYDYVLPALSHSPSPIKEVFIRYTSWDIVLSELESGTYNLQALAQAETETYTWLINLVIERRK